MVVEHIREKKKEESWGNTIRGFTVCECMCVFFPQVGDFFDRFCIQKHTQMQSCILQTKRKKKLLSVKVKSVSYVKEKVGDRQRYRHIGSL